MTNINKYNHNYNNHQYDWMTTTFPKDIVDTVIGFDKMFERMSVGEKATYPPYNVIKQNDDMFIIDLAVAGFTRDTLEVIEDNGTIIVKGNIETKTGTEYIYKGIACRKFTRKFTLAEYMHVKAVDLVNGILSIAVVREVPAEKKPKTFTIK